MRAKQKSKLQNIVIPIPQPIPQTRQQKIHNFLQKVEDKVVQLIDSSTVKIPKQKIPFIEIKKDDPEVIANKLKKMQLNRELMQSKLQSINEQQQDLKIQHRQLEKLYNIQSRILNKDKSSSPINFRPRSQLSHQDITLLKKLKKQHKQFQQSLNEKTRIHQQMMFRLKKQQQQLEEIRKKQQIQIKKKQITKRLEILSQHRIQRQKQFQQQKRKLIEIKTKRKLYLQCQKNQKQKQKNQLEKKVALMQSRLKQRQLDLQSIKQHQQKYQQIKSQQIAIRLRKRQEFQQLSKQRKQDVSFQKSKYYTIVLQQQKKKKILQQQKQKQKLEMIQAAKIYAEQIKRDHSPRIKTKSSESSQQKKQQGLTFQQVKQIGNTYMFEVKKIIKKRDQSNKSKFSNQQKDKTISLKVNLNSSNTSSTKYRDYLSQRRLLKPKQTDKMNQTQDKIKDRFIRRDLQDVYKIMNSKQDKLQKLQRVKTIAHKLQVRQKGNDNKIIDKISAKLKILQTLTQDQ